MYDLTSCMPEEIFTYKNYKEERDSAITSTCYWRTPVQIPETHKAGHTNQQFQSQETGHILLVSALTRHARETWTSIQAKQP